MNYTQTYRKIYEVLSVLDIPHEKRHNSSLRITNALSDIYIYTNRQFPEVLPVILEIAQDFCSEAQIGGYDLDDDRIKAFGLKNNK